VEGTGGWRQEGKGRETGVLRRQDSFFTVKILLKART